MKTAAEHVDSDDRAEGRDASSTTGDGSSAPELTPTSAQYQAFDAIFDHFNATLFEGGLPSVMLTFSRRARVRGWFKPNVWEASTHEIALNPDAFGGRTPAEIASTIVHEMVHLWQAVHGKPTRRGYHNVEWATQMEKVGLVPSDTGAPGGKKTGQRVSHYIQEGGPFAEAFEDLGEKAFFPFGVATAVDSLKTSPQPKRNKTRHTCPSCDQNAWGKPHARLICGDCKVPLISGT